MEPFFRVCGQGLTITVFYNDSFIVAIEATLKQLALLPAPPQLKQAATAIDDYLSGKKTDFSSLSLDKSRLTPFQQKVFAELEKIPAGEVVTYEDLAKRVKTANHRRAVAMALAHNPFPIVIPCHRVVPKGFSPKNSGVGGYSSGDRSEGPAIKALLLKMEGVIG